MRIDVLQIDMPHIPDLHIFIIMVMRTDVLQLNRHTYSYAYRGVINTYAIVHLHIDMHAHICAAHVKIFCSKSRTYRR